MYMEAVTIRKNHLGLYTEFLIPIEMYTDSLDNGVPFLKTEKTALSKRVFPQNIHFEFFFTIHLIYIIYNNI